LNIGPDAHQLTFIALIAAQSRGKLRRL